MCGLCEWGKKCNRYIKCKRCEGFCFKKFSRIGWTEYFFLFRNLDDLWPWPHFNGDCYFIIQEAWLIHLSSGTYWHVCIAWHLTFIPEIFLGSEIFQKRRLVIIFLLFLHFKVQKWGKVIFWVEFKVKVQGQLHVKVTWCCVVAQH